MLGLEVGVCEIGESSSSRTEADMLAVDGLRCTRLDWRIATNSHREGSIAVVVLFCDCRDLDVGGNLQAFFVALHKPASLSRSLPAP